MLNNSLMMENENLIKTMRNAVNEVLQVVSLSPDRAIPQTGWVIIPDRLTLTCDVILLTLLEHLNKGRYNHFRHDSGETGTDKQNSQKQDPVSWCEHEAALRVNVVHFQK